MCACVRRVCVCVCVVCVVCAVVRVRVPYLSLGDGVEERTVYNPHGERIGKEEEEMRTDVNVEIIEVRAHVWFSVHNTTVTVTHRQLC